MDNAVLSANKAKPSARQLNWQRTEFYGLISYGMPVFTGKQYGDGFTPPSVFWPEEMNTDVWCEVAKSAGMRGLVLTAKHYDGFCLWPTAHTDYSVKKSNWMSGEGDLVRMTAESCRRYGLKFGIYIAPWDRHEPTYGTGKPYDDFFCGLLTELLTNYGDLFCVWLDGICGASETKVQAYDWGRYYQLIRALQPDAVISFRGPDVRWSGNDRGAARAEEWSPVPAGLGVAEDGSSPALHTKKPLSLMSPDLGSRKAIRHETEFVWYPCEVSVPMHTTWFHAPDDKYTMKTKDKLQKLYYNTVGNNACLMLGLSPDKRGAISETDTKILSAFGKDLALFFCGNILSEDGALSVNQPAAQKDLESIRQNNSACWRYDSKEPVELHVAFSKEEMFDKIVLQEHIENGQHIEAFEIFIKNAKGRWKSVYKGTAVGYKKICPLEPARSTELKIVFSAFRSFFELQYLQIN